MNLALEHKGAHLSVLGRSWIGPNSLDYLGPSFYRTNGVIWIESSLHGDGLPAFVVLLSFENYLDVCRFFEERVGVI